MTRGAVVSVWVSVWMALGSASGAQPSKPALPKMAEILQGEILEVKLTAPDLSAVEGRLGNERIHFYRSQGGRFTALVGVDLEANPGVVKLLVKGTTHSGARRETQMPVKIKAKPFKTESISVAQELDQFGAEVLERIRREQEQLARVFMISSPQRLWAGPFLTPVSKEVTSPFGYRRVVNGTPRAPHTGVDLKAAMGTEVIAANHGRVVLLGDFFFSGKSVVLDHGGGLYTLYYHLSEFKAEDGMEARKGDSVALSGMTGRVTGPHLHWGIRINDHKVDPLSLLRLFEPSGTTTRNSQPVTRNP